MSEAMTAGSLLRRARECDGGEIVSVKPNGLDWRFIEFQALRLPAEASLHLATGNNEVAIVVIGGTINVSTSGHKWRGIGERSDPFSGPPATVYLPAGVSYELVTVGAAEIAICAAPGRGEFAARLIQPTDVRQHVRGSGKAERTIRDILMDDDEAGSLFLTEVITPPGNWSSYPPHKHDTDDLPRESQLEELYYYRVQPSSGFAFQRVYDPKRGLDETVTAHDRDVVLVPSGYHVCAAAAEYCVYYLNVLAGPKHVYRMSFDPAHAWIKERWTW